MTYSKTVRHAIASRATAGARICFKCLPANTNNSIAFPVWQVANNSSVTKDTKFLLFSLALIPYSITRQDD